MGPSIQIELIELIELDSNQIQSFQPIQSIQSEFWGARIQFEMIELIEFDSCFFFVVQFFSFHMEKKRIEAEKRTTSNQLNHFNQFNLNVWGPEFRSN